VAKEILQAIIEAFPQADPASEFYNEEISGCEAVNFLSQIIPRIREYLDAPPPTMAIILEGGLVQCIVSDHPGNFPPMNFMVLDYDTEGADEEELLQVPQKDGSVSTATGRYLGFDQADIGLAAVMDQLDARGC
jgi:hypothetical protein